MGHVQEQEQHDNRRERHTAAQGDEGKLGTRRITILLTPSPKRHRRYKRARRSSSIQHYTRAPVICAVNQTLDAREQELQKEGHGRSEKPKKRRRKCFYFVFSVSLS